VRPYSRHLADLCQELADSEPDGAAVVSGEERLSFARLAAEMARCAGALSELGVRRGGTVGLLCTNRWEWLAVAFGAMRLGARVAAFNTFARAWDLAHMLAHSEAEVLITVDRFRSRDYLSTLEELVPELERREWSSGRFPRLREVVVIGDAPAPPGARRLAELVASADGLEGPAAGSAADDAFVLYTSGSTARPKAVPLQHYALIENGHSIGERMALTHADRVWVSVPLFWAYGAVNALPATLTHGAALVLQEAFDPGEALHLIEAHECTGAYTLPNMTSAMVSHPHFHPSRTASLRTGLTLGTEPDLRRAAEVLAVPEICNIYGGTETYGNCCVTPAHWPLERRLRSQGPPLPGMRLRLADPDTGAPVKAGELGEVHVSGYVARGYLRASEEENRAFGDDGWFRTGDLGRLDEDGCLHFESRASEVIKTGGINVSPREVEELLALHPQVRDAAVAGAPHEVAGQIVVAFVVLEDPGADLGDEALRAFCAERVAAYKVPARIHFVDSLPKTETGKLARRVLAEAAAREGVVQ
jgi:fatty-acyl-CoA synthase